MLRWRPRKRDSITEDLDIYHWCYLGSWCPTCRGASSFGLAVSTQECSSNQTFEWCNQNANVFQLGCSLGQRLRSVTILSAPCGKAVHSGVAQSSSRERKSHQFETGRVLAGRVYGCCLLNKSQSMRLTQLCVLSLSLQKPATRADTGSRLMRFSLTRTFNSQVTMWPRRRRIQL
jgi:hypothetical protein